MKCWLIALMLALSAIARAEDPGFGRPIVALTTGVGYDVDEGSGELVFALYPDGHVIYAAKEAVPATAHRFRVTQLNHHQVEALLRDLKLDRIGSLGVESPTGDDGGTDCIFVYDRRSRKRECYWPGLDGYPFEQSPLPALTLMADIWKRLSRFTSESARPWSPKTIQVAFANTNLVAGAAKWPSTWPAPTSPEHVVVVPRVDVEAARLRLDTGSSNRAHVIWRDEGFLVTLTPSVPTLPR